MIGKVDKNIVMEKALEATIASRFGVLPNFFRLASIDPTSAARLHTNDTRRVIRALEVYEQTGIAITTLRRQAPRPRDLQPTTLVLDPPQEALRGRIEAAPDAV